MKKDMVRFIFSVCLVVLTGSLSAMQNGFVFTATRTRSATVQETVSGVSFGLGMPADEAMAQLFQDIKTHEQWNKDLDEEEFKEEQKSKEHAESMKQYREGVRNFGDQRQEDSFIPKRKSPKRKKEKVSPFVTNVHPRQTHINPNNNRERFSNRHRYNNNVRRNAQRFNNNRNVFRTNNNNNGGFNRFMPQQANFNQRSNQNNWNNRNVLRDNNNKRGFKRFMPKRKKLSFDDAMDLSGNNNFNNSFDRNNQSFGNANKGNFGNVRPQQITNNFGNNGNPFVNNGRDNSDLRNREIRRLEQIAKQVLQQETEDKIEAFRRSFFKVEEKEISSFRAFEKVGAKDKIRPRISSKNLNKLLSLFHKEKERKRSVCDEKVKETRFYEDLTNRFILDKFLEKKRGKKYVEELIM